MPFQTRQGDRTPTRRPSWLEGDQTVTGSFLLDLGIARRISIRESPGKAPCQIVAQDNAMMDQASHQDH
jgi:hypothetical protein